MDFEIGSEFEFDYESIISNNPKDLDQFFQTHDYKLVSSGRCGIKQVLLNVMNERDDRDEYLLPSYLCPSIVQAYKELNVKIVYYNVRPNLTIDLSDLKEKVNRRTKAVYIIHYFGVLQPKEILSYLTMVKNTGICLIEDITHNFFSRRADIGDYLIASLRKWGPLPHGGAVMVNRKADTYQTFFEPPRLALKIGQLRAFGQQLKYLYLNGLEDANVKKAYLKILRDMDEALYSHIEIAPMDELSVNLLKRMDFEGLARKRRENYKFLYNQLNSLKEIHIVVGDIKQAVTPLGFHITLENRDELRRYLVKNGVYSSIHWGLPNEVQEGFEDSAGLSKKLLTIPCDQRYGEREMGHIVELLQAYFSKAEGAKRLVSQESG